MEHVSLKEHVQALRSRRLGPSPDRAYLPRQLERDWQVIPKESMPNRITNCVGAGNCCVKGILGIGGLMDKCVQMLDKELWRLGPDGSAYDSTKNVAKEEVSASGSNEICVSGDSKWKTRGHTSRISVCSAIGDVTGKVIDVAVLSSYYKGCEKWRGPKSGHSYEEWKLKHQPHCVKNHIGS
ncbi:hypothetical protein TNCV_2224531 [Trichonephila clavipes]|nr:hypothetical protein TNCV_2224531 [Trichonephila clavipes]